MDEIPIKKDDNRNPDGTFKPGSVPNPNGRPRKERCFSNIARELLSSNKIEIEYTFNKDGEIIKKKLSLESSKTMYHAVVSAMIKEALDGNVNAFKELADRVDGKPQTLEDELPDKKSVTNIIIKRDLE